MFADNAQISHRQLFRQILMALMGSWFLIVPVFSELSGRQGILSLLTGMLLLFFFCTWFIRMKGFFQNPEKYMGKTGSRIFILLYISWLWTAGVCLLLMIARITERFFIEGSISWAVIALAALVAYLGSHQGLERRARMAEVCFPVLFLVLAGMLLSGIFRVKLAYLYELGGLTVQGWLRGTYQVLCAFLPFAFLPVTLGNVTKPGGTRRAMWGAAALLTGLLSLSLLLLQGSFGLGGYEHKKYPMIDFMAGMRLPGDFLERLDIFWAAAVLFSVLFGLGSVFFYQHELLVRAKIEKAAPFFAAAILTGAEICEKLEVSEEIFIHLTMSFYAPFMGLLLLCASFCSRRKHGAVKMLLLLTVLTSLAASFTGCGVALEKRVFPLAMSADYAAGQYQLIYGIPGLTTETGQKKAGTEETKPQAVIYEGKQPKEAEEKFSKNQDNYLDMGHIKVLLLGKRLLQKQDALEEFLGYLEEKPSVAGNLYVFSSREVNRLMSLEGEEAVGDYLTGILENNLQGKTAVKLQDLYNAWHRQEPMPKIPEVIIMNKKPFIRQYS